MQGAGRLINCTHHSINPGTLSSFEDVTVVVGDGTAAALQAYLTSPEYGAPGQTTAWAALVFDKIPGDGGPVRELRRHCRLH